jgi:predicted Zn-dependent peptidase
MVDIIDELKKLLETPVPDGELNTAKKAYQAQFDNSLTVDQELVGAINEQLETGRTFAYNGKLNAQVQAVTAPQLVAALKKYVKLDGLAKIEAGDIK